jgi:hypothetical protein
MRDRLHRVVVFRSPRKCRSGGDARTRAPHDMYSALPGAPYRHIGAFMSPTAAAGLMRQIARSGVRRRAPQICVRVTG